MIWARDNNVRYDHVAQSRRRACIGLLPAPRDAQARVVVAPCRDDSFPQRAAGAMPQCRQSAFRPSTSTIRHMLHRASASAKRLAAALRRAVPEWQLLSGWVQTGREENGSLRNGKAIIFGRTGVRSCQRHVNARMSFCECF